MSGGILQLPTEVPSPPHASGGDPGPAAGAERRASAASVPRIAVLLATHDGVRFLREQIDSILTQTGVEVTIHVSDDRSIDGTRELVQRLALADPRIKLLPGNRRFGSAAPNFYHLISSIDPVQYDAIAFADQDDVWFDWKLEHHFELLRTHRLGGVSSSVVAFWPDGRERVVEKGGAQRRYDHLLQSPGPGCTFLVSPALVDVVRTCLSRPEFGASRFVFHDWLLYGIARSCGFPWHISSRPSLRYRQHGSNEWGANSGLRAMSKRLRRLTDGTFSRWASDLLYLARAVAALTGTAPPPERLDAWQIAFQGRRRLVDRLLIALTHPRGIRVAAPKRSEDGAPITDPSAG